MGVVSGALDVIAANMAGSALPYGIAIGTSGLAFDAGQTTLGSETDRNIINSRDLSSDNQVTFISNWVPAEISGTVLREFGLMTLGSTMLTRQVLTGSEVFDGEQELQIQETIQFFF